LLLQAAAVSAAAIE